MGKQKLNMANVHDEIKSIIDRIEQEYAALQKRRINAGYDGDKESHDWMLIDEAKYEELTNHLYDAMYLIEEKFYE